jgi:hypothetical protein
MAWLTLAASSSTRRMSPSLLEAQLVAAGKVHTRVHAHELAVERQHRRRHVHRVCCYGGKIAREDGADLVGGHPRLA